MIAACPSCGARYRIDTSRLRPEGARLRCSRCEGVFHVAPPPAEPLSESAAAAPSAARPETPGAPAAAQESHGPAPDAHLGDSRERLVLIAESDPDVGKATANALGGWGLRTILVHDGVEAILGIQRALPRVVILDAALPKMFGFQVCELMKRNESLREIKVVLIGAIHSPDRYRRPPGELYGADAYLEHQQLPEAIRPLLISFGLPLSPGSDSDPAEGALPARAPSPVAPSPQPREAEVTAPEPSRPAESPAPPVAAQASPEGPTPEAGPDPHVAEAERLARIIVSDVVLYNQEKFEAALAAGNVLEALAQEMQEGHALFRQRIDPGIADSHDYLDRELLRIARQRGMQ